MVLQKQLRYVKKQLLKMIYVEVESTYERSIFITADGKLILWPVQDNKASLFFEAYFP